MVLEREGLGDPPNRAWQVWGENLAFWGPGGTGWDRVGPVGRWAAGPLGRWTDGADGRGLWLMGPMGPSAHPRRAAMVAE